MDVNKTTSRCAAFLVSAMLAGCGGGGGGDTRVGDSSRSNGIGGPGGDVNNLAPPPTPGIHGLHAGSLTNGLSNGLSHAMFVLDDEEFYIMYGIPAGRDLYAVGFFQGDGALNNGSLSAPDVRDYSTTGTVQSGSLSASFKPGVSLNGSVTSGSSTLTFTSAPPPGSPYNFHAAANPANITGAWNIRGMQGMAVVLSIGTNGAFTGSVGVGCSLSGTMTPRASGKNVFDMAFVYGPAPCVSPGVSMMGIALEYRLPDGRQQLVVAGADSGRTMGEAFLGAR
ncbi:MAG: hypothetical protein JWM42_1623 [Burkholderia sp.]|nr:hypothetical protein [Burkholderia sp.]